MFIRFVSGEINEQSHLAADLFWAAYDLRESDGLPEYELEALNELRDWFNLYLYSPFDFLRDHKRYDPAVCWFKSTAYEYLAKARELVTILERNDILIWTLKSHRTGYVYYEDEVQVFARPYRDVREQM
jgi:hypothetical protein